MKENDLPNWVIFISTVILWPLALFVWNNRKIGNVPNLEVSLLKKDGFKIGEKEYKAVELRFANNTGSVVYLTNYRVLKCSKHFPVHPDSERDIKDRTIPIKFYNSETNIYDRRQITLQTSEKASTAIPLTISPSNDMIAYTPSCFRNFFRWRKYFWIEYTAMVGPQMSVNKMKNLS